MQAGYRDYQEISYSRAALKRFMRDADADAAARAVLGARPRGRALRAVQPPLGLLAEGTRAVAQGDFTPPPAGESRDELGVLTESFNTMTAQLAEAQHKAEESRRAIETTRAYLESILANLSAGVLAFDDALSAAHRQSERGRDPAAAARRPDRRRRSPTGADGCRRSAPLPSSSPKAFAPAATDSGRSRRSSRCRITHARC